MLVSLLFYRNRNNGATALKAINPIPYIGGIARRCYSARPCLANRVTKRPSARVIRLLPDFGCELICPLFGGAIGRPISPDSCIVGIKVAIAGSYGVGIRSRDSAPFLVNLGCDDNAPASAFGPEAGVPPATTAAGEYVFAALSAVSGSGTDSRRTGVGAISTGGPVETDACGVATARDPSTDSMEVAAPRPNTYGAAHGSDVDPVSTTRVNTAHCAGWNCITRRHILELVRAGPLSRRSTIPPGDYMGRFDANEPYRNARNLIAPYHPTYPYADYRPGCKGAPKGESALPVRTSVGIRTPRRPPINVASVDEEVERRTDPVGDDPFSR